MVFGYGSHSSLRIDAFWLWCWRRLLRVPWTARRSNQVLREINPENSLEGLMLKLKLQYFGHLMWRVHWTLWKRPWWWERLKAGGEGDDKGWDSWMASLTQWTWVWANSGRYQRTGKPGGLQSTGSKRVRHNLMTEQQSTCAYVLSHFSCVQLFVTLWTVASQAPQSMGILQAGMLECVAMPSSRGSSQLRDWIRMSYFSWISRWLLYHLHHLGSLNNTAA